MIKTTLLAYRHTLQTKQSKQIITPPSSNQTNLDIWIRTMSKLLQIKLNVPWFTTNAADHQDSEVDLVKEEIRRFVNLREYPEHPKVYCNKRVTFEGSNVKVIQRQRTKEAMRQLLAQLVHIVFFFVHFSQKELYVLIISS